VSILSGFAKGLLSLLDSQNFGEAPRELGAIVVPTVDAGDLYLLNKQVGVVQVLAAPVNGNNAGGGLVVPQGEVWRIHAGGVFVLAGVGVTLDITPIAIVSGIVVPLGTTQSILASTTRMLPMLESPLWLSAGSELSCYITAIAGAPTVSIAYIVSKLKA